MEQAVRWSQAAMLFAIIGLIVACMGHGRVSFGIWCYAVLGLVVAERRAKQSMPAE